jgi:glycerol-3-phosphate acyltransferase PlsY
MQRTHTHTHTQAGLRVYIHMFPIWYVFNFPDGVGVATLLILLVSMCGCWMSSFIVGPLLGR